MKGKHDYAHWSRAWAMPTSDTFQCKPIGDFVKKYLKGISIDPFARNSTLCTFTNDLNPSTRALFHMQAPLFFVHARCTTGQGGYDLA